MRITTTGCLLLTAFMLVSCYEERSEVRLIEDGSVYLEQELTISDRMIVATQEAGGNSSFEMPFSKSEEELRKNLESAGATVEGLESREGEDGSMVFKHGSRFPDFASFQRFNGGDGMELLEMAPDSADTVRVTVPLGAQEEGDGQMNMELNQLYGMAKGMYIERTIHFPAAVTDTNGEKSEDGRTVTWVYDLRDRKGLEETRQKAGGKASFTGYAVFPADASRFEVAEEPGSVASAGTQKATQASPESVADYNVAIDFISWSKQLDVNEPEDSRKDSRMDLGFNVSWPAGSAPVALYGPEVTSAADNLGNAIERRGTGSPHRNEVDADDEDSRFRTYLDSPDMEAESLSHLEGTIRVVLNQTTETIRIENFRDLVGQDQTGHEALDAIGFKVEELKVNGITVSVDEGTVDDLVDFQVLKDGEPYQTAGGGGSSTRWTYYFQADPSDADAVEVTIMTGEETAELPFSFKDVKLP